MYTILVPYVFPQIFKILIYGVLKTGAEMVKKLGKKITVCMYWKSRQSHLRMFCIIFSEKIFSFTVDTIYGFAVNPEWKKRIKSDTYMKGVLGSFE